MEKSDDRVAFIVRTMSTSQNKCKLQHCFQLHYGSRDDLCVECEQESIVEALYA